MLIVTDIYTGEEMQWSLKDVLNEINRDRTAEWVDYDETDYIEGWSEWCEGECYTIPSIKDKEDVVA